MSELAVGSLKGLAANSFVIDVASGSSLDLSAGAVLPAGSVLQVVSTTKTDAFSTTSSSFADVTGLTATITPSSTNSKILVIANVTVSNTGGDGLTQLVRTSTAIGSGGSGFGQVSSTSPLGNQTHINAINFLDSPSTISATTYKIQTRVASTGTQFVNRRGVDTSFGTSSHITLMEIAG